MREPRQFFLTFKNSFMVSPCSVVGMKTNEPDKIIGTICRYMDVPVEKIMTSCRKREYVYARHLCFYFLKKKTPLTLESIGEKFAGRDHTTVMHGLHTLRDLHDTEERTRHDVAQLSIVI